MNSSALATTRPQTLANRPPEEGLKSLLAAPAMAKRFNDVLGARAPQFVSSLMSLGANLKASPMSIIASGMIAASLDLPINQNLGFAYIVAYSGEAQFQMGYKGFIQLGLRTGQYRFLNACLVYEGELVRRNKMTGEVVIDEEKRTGDTVVGYASYFQLINGFEHALYMSVEECKAHAKKYSQTYKKGFGKWVDDFDGMALKTVIKLLLSHWGILSVQMQNAIETDMSVIKQVGDTPTYPDNAPTVEIKQARVGQLADTAAAEEVPQGEPVSEPAPEPAQSRTQTRETRAPQQTGKPLPERPKQKAQPQQSKQEQEKKPEQEAAAAAAPAPDNGPLSKADTLREKLRLEGLTESSFVAMGIEFTFFDEGTALDDLSDEHFALIDEQWDAVVAELKARKEAQ